MTIKTDLEIAQSYNKKKIIDVANAADIDEKYLELYGNYKAKIDCSLLKEKENNPNGKLVLVTAINPTSAGEGKTTTTIGLADSLNKLGKKTIVALREPSLGPVFGVKGGATGGGYSQIVPMEDINLHFTGDFHAIGAANNLLAAMIDNHIYQGNSLGIDLTKVTWRRAIDMNDRQLRTIISGLKSKTRNDGFDITVASEVMAILCLSENIIDLKKRLGEIIIGYSYNDEPITASQLNAHGAMAVLLKDALKPNLVQTLEGNPVLVHGGPFANIAHGCNSIIATKMAMKMSEYTITEAGFGADLGAEKFLDIKCRKANIKPDAVVIVATVRALKLHGGLPKSLLNNENLEALEAGIPNLLQHIDNIINVFKLPCTVAINVFPTDTKEEIALIKEKCSNLGINVIISEVWEKGSEGGIELAKEVIQLCEKKQNDFEFCYDLDLPIVEKINMVANKIYKADNIQISNQAMKEINKIEKLGFGNLPICMAKTQYSFSDDSKKLGAPRNFNIQIKDVKIAAGAGFIVVLTGDILTMPGLPKEPAAENIDINEYGIISGLF